MRILFSINHPSQFHMFKHLAKKLVADGNDVIFFIQTRGIIEQLIQTDGFEYKYSTSPKLRSLFNGKLGIIARGIISLLQQEKRILWYSLTHKVDFLLGTDIAIAHTGFLLRKPAMVFSDDDYVFTKPYCNMAFPYAKHIISPIVTDAHKWESKKIGYKGTQKAAYLHPDYFKHDKSILDKYNLRNTKYFILRLVAYAALHDSLHNASSGISEEAIDQLIPLLEEKGKVIISVEGKRIPKYNKYILNIDPNDIHSLIYYADLFIGDSQSMHVEAGLLGTPSIRSNKWVIAKDRVNVIDYLENEYNMGISIEPGNLTKLIQNVEKLLCTNSKQNSQEIRNRFFTENTNLTDFLYWLLTNYPQSIHEYQTNRDIIDEFH